MGNIVGLLFDKKKCAYLLVLFALFTLLGGVLCPDNAFAATVPITDPSCLHNLTPSGPAGQNFSRGVCRECHIPHVSQDIRLWHKPQPDIGTPNPSPPFLPANNNVRRMCLDCHGYDTGQITTQLPNYGIEVIWGFVGTTPPQITDNVGNPINVNHSSGRDNCTECHLHDDCFRPTQCDACHGWPPGYDYDLAVPCNPLVIPEAGKVGSTDDVCNINAPEAGANPADPTVNRHVYHSRHYSDGRIDNTLYTGLPKMNGICLGNGCHATKHQGDPTDVDFVGDVIFDLYSDATVSIKINKEPTQGIMGGIGDGISDVLSADPGIAQINASYNGATTECNNVYCHSNVQQNPPNGPYNLTYGMPKWNGTGLPANDPGKVYCGRCHDDNTSTAVDDEHTGTIMSSGSHTIHASTNSYACTVCHYERGKLENYTPVPLGDTTTDGYHVNGFIDTNFYRILVNAFTGDFNINPDPGGPGESVYNGTNTKIPGDPYTTCTNLYCHSNAFTAKIKAGDTAPDGATIYYTPTWGAPGGLSADGPCEGCHGRGVSDPVGLSARYGAPDTYSGTAGTYMANSHAAHLGATLANLPEGESMVSAIMSCSYCHYDTTSDDDFTDGWTITNPSLHLNGVVDIKSFEGITGDFGYDMTPGEKRCYKSCHGNFDPVEEPLEAPQWGGGCAVCHNSHGGPMNTYCSGCHYDVEDLASIGDDVRPRPTETVDGIPNRLSSINSGNQYDTNGHGAMGMTNRSWKDSITTPGCLSNSTDPATPTDGCHYQGNPATWGVPNNRNGNHFPKKDPLDPYRLGPVFANDLDGFCMYCHGLTGASFMTITVSHTEASTRSNQLPPPTQPEYQQTPPVWPFTPKCVDCHDPHGDNNVKMVKGRVSRDYGSNDFGTPITSLGTINNPYINNPAPTGEPLVNPDYDTTQAAAVAFTANSTAGDFYNTAGDNGICQVCHTQNLVYNRISSGVRTHENNVPSLPVSEQFLPEGGRPCTTCHLHDDMATGMKGFARPYIDNPYNNTPVLCTDCHLWNPNGTVTSPNHPLLEGKADGGVLEGLADPTDQNDDIDNYIFGADPWPGDHANFTDRAMIDAGQWTSTGHEGVAVGTVPDCYDCHEDYNLSLGQPVDHGDATNPYRLMGASPYNTAIPDTVCSTKVTGDSSGAQCHGALPVATRPHQHNFTGAYEEGVCFDCHDPHGDSANADTSLNNIPDTNTHAKMLHREIIYKNRWVAPLPGVNAYGEVLAYSVDPVNGNSYPVARFLGTGAQNDYAKEDNVNGINGICEVCHDGLDNFDGSPHPVRWFMRDAVDNDPIPIFHDITNINFSCGICHTHPIPGFAPADWCDCVAICHTGVGSQFSPMGTDTSKKHDIEYSPNYVAKGNDLLREDCQDATNKVDCLKCHDLDSLSAEPMFSGEKNHMDGTAYLNAVGGGTLLQSQSVYKEETNAIKLEIPMYGNTKSDDPNGVWCGNCHDGQTGATYQWFNNTNDPPNVRVSTDFVSSGHGATSGTNFTRYPPNSIGGRTSCTACHNYHGSPNKAMIMRATWDDIGGSWIEPYPYPDDGDPGTWDDGVASITYDVNGFANNVVVDPREVFCLEACHINASDPEFSSDIAADTTSPGGGPGRAGGMRAHYIFNYGGNLPTGASTELERYNEHENTIYYFVSKAVGFVMGGTDSTSKYVADSASGEAVTLNEVASPGAGTISEKLAVTVAQSDILKGRALCSTCHDPHGGNVDTTWGNTAAADDQMLRDRLPTGSPFTTTYEPCEACHPAGP